MVPLCHTGDNPVYPRTSNQLIVHAMSRLPTTASAMTAPAALTLPEQDLKQAENQVSTDLADSSAADTPRIGRSPSRWAAPSRVRLAQLVFPYSA
jgi:hypothetical protein